VKNAELLKNRCSFAEKVVPLQRQKKKRI